MQHFPPLSRLNSTTGTSLLQQQFAPLAAGAPLLPTSSSAAITTMPLPVVPSNFENYVQLQKTLKGDARESVKSLLIHTDNVSVLMEQPRFRYGCPEILIRYQLQQVKEIQPIGESAIDRLVPFAVKVQNLSAFLKSDNGQQYLASLG